MTTRLRALAVNLIPPLGVAIFGWSTLVVLLMIYVDAFALVAAASLVLAVSIADEEPRPPGRLTRLRFVAAVWGAGVAILGFFPFVGAVLLFSVMGMPWGQLQADVASESGIAAAVLLVAAVHGRDAVARLSGDRRRAEREAVDEFSVMLLRAFAFPVAGGLVLLAAAPFGRAGQLGVLVLLSLTMTAGDVYRDQWLRLVAPGNRRAAPTRTDGDRVTGRR